MVHHSQTLGKMLSYLTMNVAEGGIVASRTMLPGGDMERGSVRGYMKKMQERYRVADRAEHGTVERDRRTAVKC